MSRHLLARIEVYSESPMALFDSEDVPNVMLHKIVRKLHLRMKPTNRKIKVANCASNKCVVTLNEVQIPMGELALPMDLQVLEKTVYDILISLPTMIQLHARPDCYRMVLKTRDSKILNYEYEREDVSPPRTNSHQTVLDMTNTKKKIRLKNWYTC